MHATDRLKQFSAKHRLRLSDIGAEQVVSGRFGEIADMGDPDGSLRLRLLAVPRTRVMTGALRNRFRQAETGGLRLKVKADAESIWYFDPANPAEANLAIRLVGAKRRRQVSEAQRQAMTARLAAAQAARLARVAE